MSYIHVCMTLSGMWPVMYTWGPTTISGVLISAPGVLMDNDNDNHLFLHLSPESRILSAQKWQKSLMKPGRAREEDNDTVFDTEARFGSEQLAREFKYQNLHNWL